MEHMEKDVAVKLAEIATQLANITEILKGSISSPGGLVKRVDDCDHSINKIYTRLAVVEQSKAWAWHTLMVIVSLATALLSWLK